MGTRTIALPLLLLLFAISASADLQFTPKVVEYELDNITFKQLAFSDGTGKEVTYQQPDGWDYSGSAAKLTLHPPKAAQAEGTITTVTLSQPGVFDGATPAKLAEEVLASAPKGSTNVTLVSQEKNPLLIGRKETLLIIISYTFYGQNYERSVMFLNRGNEQVRFQFVSRAADFKDLQRAFLASQFTWKNL
jgi:hypothetical protein